MSKSSIYQATPQEKYSEQMARLKYAASTGIVVKGLKETLRAIESGKAKIVYCAKNDNENYMSLIQKFSEIYKTECLVVDNWLELRDTLFQTKPSFQIIEEARRQGKIPKINPKCYCAAIIDTGEMDVD
jgi:ribosomal protein L7Ae-like RNA K-turn-binding protein